MSVLLKVQISNRKGYLTGRVCVCVCVCVSVCFKHADMLERHNLTLLCLQILG